MANGEGTGDKDRTAGATGAGAGTAAGRPEGDKRISGPLSHGLSWYTLPQRYIASAGAPANTSSPAIAY